MTVRYDVDGAIATLTFDAPGADVNTVSPAFVTALAAAVDRLEEDRSRLVGAVLTSSKPSFVAGADLEALSRITPADAGQVFAEIERTKAVLRRIETLGLPVVAAIGGSALGAGLEIALACHRRILVDGPSCRIGLPEVTFGLLPGAGGVTRTVRMLGLADALTKVLLKGTLFRPGDALAIGLVDEIAADRDALMPAARQWLVEHEGDDDAGRQPWDRPGYRIPGGTPATPQLAAVLPAFPATLRKQLKGAPYPAPRTILAAAVEGSQVDFDTALRIESRAFTKLATSPTANVMIRALWCDLREVESGLARPADFTQWSPSKVAVVGAGMMGAGIAHACASAGLAVVLVDRDQDTARRGRRHTEKLVAEAVGRGRLTEPEASAIVERIRPTGDLADIAGCDLVIEAVFEDVDVKHETLAEAERLADPAALLSSNTSTLPISELAESVRRRESLVGLHFFSPVERMRLVEIVVGRDSSPAAVARAYDVVRLLGKTPIVVRDGRGFFTSRVFGTFVMEGAAMVAEGVSPVTIERAALQAGFPAGPLALLDEVTLTLPRHIRDAASAAGDAASAGAFGDHPGMAVVDVLVDEVGRTGRSGGAGFYDYLAEGEKVLWRGLWERFATRAAPCTPSEFRTLQDRLLFAMAVESARCLDEGVVRTRAEANVGSILGIGFPALYGGVARYADGYPGGSAAFVARAEALAEQYGARFAPPASLVARTETAVPA